MNSGREEVWVGLFVLIAAVVLIVTVLSVAGTFHRGTIAHRAYFKFAGGLEPGAPVRFGGMKAGSIQAVRVDPKDSTRIEIDFNVARDIPLKVDSLAKITSLGVLGDNYLELTTGTGAAVLAAPGSVVKSAESLTIDDLTNMAGALEPVIQQALRKVNQRLDELQVTVTRANDLLNDRNRANISASLATVNSMLAEDRPKLSATLDNVQTASARLTPLLADMKKTMAEANGTLGHVDTLVLQNRENLGASLTELRQTLLTASSLMNQLDQMVDSNAENIDETLENVRVTTQQLRELTENLKRRPYTLIRAYSPRERRPGDK